MAGQRCCEQIAELAQVFNLLGDATRLRVIALLAREEQNVGSLCKKLKVNQPTMSHHLGLLRLGRAVRGRRNGKEVIYSVDREKIGGLMKQFRSCVGKK